MFAGVPAENRGFVCTTPFAFSFLSEVFNRSPGRRGAGGQAVKMKQLVKRKLLNGQIVLSGWVLCSRLRAVREGTVGAASGLLPSRASQQLSAPPAAAGAPRP